MIRPKDVVADIGCGIGIVSRYLAAISRKVIAIDKDENALKVLNEDLNRLGLENIEVVHARWPSINTDDWDVAVAFYHHHFGFTTFEIETLLRKTAAAVWWSTKVSALVKGSMKILAGNLA